MHKDISSKKVNKNSLQDYAKKHLGQNVNLTKFYTAYEIEEYFFSLPYLPEVEIFCLRLLKAILLDENICVYADFDTDAVTSTGVMVHGLIDLGIKPDKIKFYTPDRFKEGYGVNLAAIKTLSKTYSLIITVDCGINSTIEAEFIKGEEDCDLIITDHHLSAGERPDCVAVCNPQMEGFFKTVDSEPYLHVLTSNFDKLYSELINIESNLFSSVHKQKLTIYKDKFLKRIVELKKVGLGSEVGFSFLSKSTTGVGVAWFSVLYLAYFLDEISFNLSINTK